MREAADIFQLNAWQRFGGLKCRIQCRFNLNMMMSMSGSWVFLVASRRYRLPIKILRYLE